MNGDVVGKPHQQTTLTFSKMIDVSENSLNVFETRFLPAKFGEERKDLRKWAQEIPVAIATEKSQGQLDSNNICDSSVLPASALGPSTAFR
jgi:hypothetical protein